MLISLGIIYINGTLANLTDYERNNLGVQSRTDANNHYNVSIVDCKNPEDSIMSRTDLFSNIKWCPGRTEILNLEVTNNELFPLMCSLDIKANTTQNRSSDTLFNVFSYAVIEKDENYVQPANWVQFYDLASNKGDLSTDKASVFTIPSFAQSAKKSYALAIHMNENASEDYIKQEMAISFDLYIEANYEPGATPT